jgi:uncharacterized alpha-E superfamily protein
MKNKYLSIRSADGLYWIGRYLQRFEIIAKESIKTFDVVIDIDKEAGKLFFTKLSKDINYNSAVEFFYKIVYEVKDSNLFYLIDQARENATMLRDILDEDAFMFINVIYTNLKERDRKSISPKEIEKLIRTLDSFWGRIFLKTQHGIVQMLIEFGQTVEGIDIKLRLFENDENINDSINLKFDVQKLNTIGIAINPEFTPVRLENLTVSEALQKISSCVNEIIRYES